MDTATYVMLGVLTFAVLVLTTIGLTFFFRSFNERTRYLKREIARASGADELEYWKHKLRRHRLLSIHTVSFSEPVSIWKKLSVKAISTTHTNNSTK